MCDDTKITFRVTPEEKAELEEFCRLSHVSVSEFLRTAIRYHMVDEPYLEIVPCPECGIEEKMSFAISEDSYYPKDVLGVGPSIRWEQNYRCKKCGCVFRNSILYRRFDSRVRRIRR